MQHVRSSNWISSLPGFTRLLMLAALLPLPFQAEIFNSGAVPDSPQLSPQRSGRGGPAGLVYMARLTPQWFDQDRRFWYRNDLRDGAREFILVRADEGVRQPAFDHERLARALSDATGEEYRATHLPFDDLEFTADGESLLVEAARQRWQCHLGTYECLASPAPEPERGDSTNREDGPGSGPPAEPDRGPGRSRGRGGDSARPLVSPDGRWAAFVRDHNVQLRSEQEEREEWELSKDGGEGNSYGRLEWSPDSRVLTAWRIEPGDRKEVYLIRSSPSEGGRAVLERRPYALPGDQFSRYEPNLFHVSNREQLKPEVERFEHQWLAPRLRWSRDGERFYHQQVDRGHQRFRVIETNTRTGAARSIIDERSETFIWTAHTENLGLEYVNWLEETGEILYVSERDGWRHLYLVDIKDGELHQITQGEWVVRAIDRIDEKERQVWFRASGRNPDQDPYLIHYYRVNFDGTGLVALTSANGNHTVQYSPGREYMVATYSRVDLPPVHELRRVSDGALLLELEQADISDLERTGWEAPEVFVAKGRDGKTDIWGIICRPPQFDPNRKYPVLEDIYAGPQGSFVPKSFSASRRYASFTDLGFIVVKIDGMGTANRSKAFHDVAWQNLQDAGFPDRIPWHQAAAARYPYYDLDRLGIYGHSAGGQNAAGALLFHPDFYKVAVASCGCHDNRMDKASWNEQWMGYPVGPQYTESSNIENAHRLRGNLFLIVGEMDTNVPPESTLRFVDALIKADKDFDLLVVPGMGHGLNAYGTRRRQEFFVRHLLGSEPPQAARGTGAGAGE